MTKPLTQDENSILKEYLNDIYQVFMKRLADLVTSDKPLTQDNETKLRALLQELIKIHSLMHPSK
jgi:hypothetical protein